MIYCILQQMFSFYFLFACFSIWFAAVFTALFSTSDDLYSSFWVSMRTLFSSSLGGFDMLSFTEKKLLGCLLLGVYLIITLIILLNLFVALFVNIYKNITKDINSNYRTMVISTYQKWKWDDEFGFFILFTSPFSIFTLVLAPFIVYSKNFRSLALKSSRLLYAGVFGFWQFVLFLGFNLVLLPFVYFIGIFHYPQVTISVSISQGNEWKNLEKTFSLKKMVVWAFCGVFILFFYIIRDSISF